MRAFTDVFIKHPVLAIVVNLIIVLVGVSGGIWAALRRGGAFDRISLVFTLVVIGSPVFVIGSVGCAVAPNIYALIAIGLRNEELREAAYGAADAGRSADETVAKLEPRFHAEHPDWVQPEWVGFGLRAFHAERTAG